MKERNQFPRADNPCASRGIFCKFFAPCLRNRFRFLPTKLFSSKFQMSSSNWVFQSSCDRWPYDYFIVMVLHCGKFCRKKGWLVSRCFIMILWLISSSLSYQGVCEYPQPPSFHLFLNNAIVSMCNIVPQNIGCWWKDKICLSALNVVKLGF